MIQPTTSFKENLQLLPSVEGLDRIEILDASGIVVATIENQPGKQGSLVVYRYLARNFEIIDADAAAHGLEVLLNIRLMRRTGPVRTRISIISSRSLMVVIRCASGFLKLKTARHRGPPKTFDQPCNQPNFLRYAPTRFKPSCKIAGLFAYPIRT